MVRLIMRTYENEVDKLIKPMYFFWIFLVLLIPFGCSPAPNEENDRMEMTDERNVVEDISDENVLETSEHVEMKEGKIVEEEAMVQQTRFKLHNNDRVKPISDDIDNKVVLLTFDDAPHHYAVEIARLLKEEKINAIFFVNGHFINDEVGKEKLKTIFELGFEIGNHTMNHPNLRDLSEEEQRHEIIHLNDLIEEITGERPRFFRAPFGVNTEVSKRIVEEEQMQWMNWTFGYDYFQEYMEKEALAEIMVNTHLLTPGANLLMHDRKWTLEALPKIIAGLMDKGYSFVDPKEIQ